MTKLLPITITSIILAWVSQHTTWGEPLPNGKQRRDKLFFLILTVCMILFVGLRTAYNDTSTYLLVYRETDTTTPISWVLGNNPGYLVIIRLCKSLGFSEQTYLLLYAVFTVSVYLWFVRKYSTDLCFTVFLLFTTGCYLFTLAAVKQCVAIAFGLLAIDRYLKNHRIRAIVYLLIALLFHPYIFMFFIIPFLNYQPWNRKTRFLLIGFILAGLALQPLLGTVVDITSIMGETFDTKDFSGEGVNPFRLAVSAVPIVLSYLSRKVIWEENNKLQNLFLNLSMLNAAIMFVGLFGTANYFARLANYFLIFQTLSLPWLLHHFEVRSRRLLLILAITGYLGYFVFENFIHRRFDSVYYSIPLIQYIKSLL